MSTVTHQLATWAGADTVAKVSDLMDNLAADQYPSA